MSGAPRRVKTAADRHVDGPELALEVPLIEARHGLVADGHALALFVSLRPAVELGEVCRVGRTEVEVLRGGRRENGVRPPDRERLILWVTDAPLHHPEAAWRQDTSDLADDRDRPLSLVAWRDRSRASSSARVVDAERVEHDVDGRGLGLPEALQKIASEELHTALNTVLARRSSAVAQEGALTVDPAHVLDACVREEDGVGAVTATEVEHVVVGTNHPRGEQCRNDRRRAGTPLEGHGVLDILVHGRERRRPEHAIQRACSEHARCGDREPRR